MNAAAKSSVAWKTDSCKVVERISLRSGGAGGGHLCCVDGETEASKHFDQGREKPSPVCCAWAFACYLPARTWIAFVCAVCAERNANKSL